MTRECHVRFCERLRVKFLGPTHLKGNRLQNDLAFPYFAGFLRQWNKPLLENRQNLPSPISFFASIP